MGNCVGQRRFARKGSGKGATPKTPTKEEGGQLRVNNETGKITTENAENLTKNNANPAAEQKLAKHTAGEEQTNIERDGRHVEGKKVENEKENGIKKNGLSKNMDEEQKAEIKDDDGEIDKQGTKNEERGTDLLKSWVVFDESILEKKGTYETKAITTSDESTNDSTDKSKEMMLPNGNTFDNENEPMNSSAASPPASPFESDFAPKFEAANATEDGKENANKEESADKQTENASTGEDERYATEITENNDLPSQEENNLKNNEGTKHLEPCDKERVLEVLDEKAVEEEYSQAKCVINVEKALFIDKLFTQKVLLETFSISGREVSGCVAAAVKGDESVTVLIRYTTDSWKSFAEEEAVPSTTDTDQIYEKFSFAISVPIGSSLEFAIECLKGDFMCWDNNNESNYFVENCVEMGEFGTLVARFLIPIDAVFADHIRKKSLSLKKACFKGGEAFIWMATNATSHELAGVRYTLDNWETSTNIKGCKIYETKHGKLGLGYDVCRASVKIPKGKTLIFVIFWHYDGHEFWDNNNEKNYEING